jgi:hypothetical protein
MQSSATTKNSSTPVPETPVSRSRSSSTSSESPSQLRSSLAGVEPPKAKSIGFFGKVKAVFSVPGALGQLQKTLNDPAVTAKWYPAFNKLGNLIIEASERCSDREIQEKIVTIGNLLCEFSDSPKKKKIVTKESYWAGMVKNLFQKIEAFIKEIDEKDWGIKLEKLLPGSLEELVKKLDLANLLADSYKEKILAYYTKVKNLEEEKEFKDLPPIKKDLVLTAKKLLCLAVEEISIKILQLEEASSFEFSSLIILNKKPLEKWREQLFAEYDALLKQAGCQHEPRINQYQRVVELRKRQHLQQKVAKLQEDLKAILEEQKSQTEIKQITTDHWKKTITNTIDLIVRKVNERERNTSSNVHQQLNEFKKICSKLLDNNQLDEIKKIFDDAFPNSGFVKYANLSSCLKGGITQKNIFARIKADFDSEEKAINEKKIKNQERLQKLTKECCESINFYKEKAKENLPQVEYKRDQRASAAVSISSDALIKDALQPLVYQDVVESGPVDNELQLQDFKKVFESILDKSKVFIDIVTPKVYVSWEEIHKSLQKLKAQLEAVLDTNTYHQYFIANQWLNDEKYKPLSNKEYALYRQYKDSEDLAVVFQPPPSISWLQSVAHAFLNVESAVLDLQKLEESFFDSSKSKPFLPAENIHAALKEAEALIAHSSGIGGAIVNLNDNYQVDTAFLKNIIEEVKKISSPIEMVIDKQINELKNNHLYQMAQKKWDEKRNNLHFALQTPFELLLEDKTLSDAEKKSLLMTLREVENTFKPLVDNPLASLGTPGMIKFLFNNLSGMLNALTHLQESAHLLTTELEASVMKILQGANELFQSIFVAMDKVEALLYLKEGCLFKIKYVEDFRKLVESFNDKVEEFHFTFKPAERYPYTSAILDARKRMADQNAIMAARQYWDDRFTFASLIVNKAAIEQSVAKKPDAFNTIDAALVDLKDKRHESLWFAKWRKDTLQTKIEALEKLKEGLQEPGCYFDQAFAKLSPSQKTILKDNEKKLLTQLQALVKVPENHAREKRTLGYSAPKLTMDNNRTDQALELIDVRVNQLRKELDAFFCWDRSTKRQKITLLYSLRSNLLQGKSVEESIEQIRGNKSTPALASAAKNFHLLFDGRTGDMMKKIRFGTLSQDQMIGEVDNEIGRLENRIKEGFWFFANYRTNKLKERIRAMKQLKSSVERDTQLNHQDSKILQSNDSKLLAKVGFWKDGIVGEKAV